MDELSWEIESITLEGDDFRVESQHLDTIQMLDAVLDLEIESVRTVC